MAATVRMSWYGGASSQPAGVTAETGLKFSRDDAQNPIAGSTTPVPIPTATGTNYSFHKNVGLEVTGSAATTISNRRVGVAASPSMPTGLNYFWKTAAYSQPTAAPTATGTDATAPSGYQATPLSTTTQLYDNTGVTANTGNSGALVQVVLGVDSQAAGLGAGAQTLATLVLTYDEA